VRRRSAGPVSEPMALIKLASMGRARSPLSYKDTLATILCRGLGSGTLVLTQTAEIVKWLSSFLDPKVVGSKSSSTRWRRYQSCCPHDGYSHGVSLFNEHCLRTKSEVKWNSSRRSREIEPKYRRTCMLPLVPGSTACIGTWKAWRTYVFIHVALLFFCFLLHLPLMIARPISMAKFHCGVGRGVVADIAVQVGLVTTTRSRILIHVSDSGGRDETHNACKRKGK
jgi:hypothetical protein